MSTDGTSVPLAEPVVGVDLGGSKVTAGLVLDGQSVVSATTPTPAQSGPEAILDAVAGLVADVRRRADTDAVAIGIGSAGVIEPGTGRVLAATHHLTDWAGTSISARMEEASGLPTRVLNDVHAHALGEVHFGAGRGLRTVLVVAAGTGLGGALVVDGTVLTGAHGAAGHLGHVPAEEAGGLSCSCGRTGHLEAIASGPGLLALYRRRGGRADSAQQVCAAARKQERLAEDCLTLAGRALGRALGGWTNMVDPDAVIVTGGLAQAGDPWWQAVAEGAAEQRIDLLQPCPIRPAALGVEAAVLGAAVYAARESHPSTGIAAQGDVHA